MTTSRFELNRAEEARAAREESQTEAFEAWLSEKHPEVRFGMALLKELKEHMLESFLTATDADWEYAISDIGTSYMRQRVPTPEEIKAALIDKICELLRNPNGGTAGGKYSDFDINTFRTKAEFMSVAELQTRLEDVTRKQTLAAQSPVQLREIVQSARKYVGYPQLGKSIVRPGTVRAVPLDAAYLRGLDAWELKKYCRLYGVEQVNARLAGKE